MAASKRGLEYGLIVLLVVGLGGVIFSKLDRDGSSEKTVVEPPRIVEDHSRDLPQVAAMGWEHHSVIFEGGTWRGRPAAADLNGDGRIDVVACNREEDGLNVFLQQDGGSWTKSNDGIPNDLMYGALGLADVDEDGDQDIVFTTHKAPVHVLLNDGKANWTVSHDGLENTTLCNSLALGDLNGDQHVDIVAGGQFNGGLLVWFGDGAGGWRADKDPTSVQAYQSSGKFAKDLALADIDGDGDLDIMAVMEWGLKPMINDGSGVFTLAESNLPIPTIGGALTSVATGDLDGDGLPEVVVCGSVDPTKPIGLSNSGMSAFKYDPEAGTWMLAGKGLDSYDVCHDARLADMNADGKLDLVTATVRRGLSIWMGDGHGAFKETARVPQAVGKSRVCVTDVDGTGGFEVLMAHSTHGALDVFAHD